MKDVSGPLPEWITLPSGVKVDVNQPDFSAVKTAEDFLELRCAIQEKIIDIELQIDMFKVGALEPGRPVELSWLPRATAAAKWAKLYRDECQTRAGQLNNREAEERRRKVETRFVEAARDLLSAKKFKELATIAGMFDD